MQTTVEINFKDSAWVVLADKVIQVSGTDVYMYTFIIIL